jgi:hypothetical protein
MDQSEPEPGSLIAFLASCSRPARALADETRSSPCSRACRAILEYGCRGYTAIAQWGRDQPIGQMHRLGYCRTP